MVLPFLPALLARTACPRCGVDEVLPRASVKVGMRHRCPSCRTTYPIEQLRSFSAPRAPGRKASKPR